LDVCKSLVEFVPVCACDEHEGSIFGRRDVFCM
jgi:hypothetical protein